MLFQIPNLSRSVDATDLSDLTSAKRTGGAVWTAPGMVSIPFDRDLSAAEVASITARLGSADSDQETFKSASTAYLNTASPTAAQTAAQVKRITRVLQGLLDKGGSQ